MITENSIELDPYVERKAFDETKEGVKGLVDAKITEVPRIFHVPQDTLTNKKPSVSASDLEIPAIDFASVHVDTASREAVVEKVKYAAEKWGFFQVVNHGIPLNVLEEIKDGVRRFHEEDPEVKKGYFSRDSANDKFVYNELLSEALGLNSKILKSKDCLKSLLMLGHYYPPCPQPDLTLGANKHSDNSFLTVLLQDDNIGGLQVLHQDSWVDVAPLPGALVINIGDYLQLMTNDKFVSLEHRVLANRQGPRISIAIFFTSSKRPNPNVYGPMKELVSEDNPPKYRDMTIQELHRRIL
ncbi:hypothetical protein EUTSA_v10014236mg [Eutrema salsugineum]|uniref:Fe2OG dioxygenase domain-containing protein n=1 Tax=Eutrema salsugineum TaxID=72664 RepID=V4KWL9_EUTSA|nr:hypothetical protein EUTSA_v10014236mg [Eutrema salsugineum]